MKRTNLKPLKIRPFDVHLRVHAYDLAAIGIIAMGVFIRFFLVFQGWPHTNIDEGTMGEMAMNIAFRGEHPVFFYGQDYMGALQAYLAAGLFRLFGVSLFTLRLGLVFLFALFLISMYLMASLLYTKKLALFSIFLLSLGANSVLYREVQAIGGYAETLLFGSVALLLASWLALSSHTSDQEIPSVTQRWRLVAYGGWGFAVGLGLWSDLLIIPSAVMSGLLLLLFCRRDMYTWAPVFLVLGLTLGALPLILFNLNARPGHDTLSMVLAIYSEGQHTPLRQLLPRSTTSAFLIGLPTATNYISVCNISETLFFGGSGPGALQCALTQGAWSLGIIALWISAAILAIRTVWTFWYRTSAKVRSFELQQDMKRSCARLAVLFAVGISFVLFAISAAAIYAPGLNARYLICVLIGTPALLYPLWKSASALKETRQRMVKIIGSSKRLILLFVTLVLLLGTVETLLDIPNAQASNQQQYDLVHNLLRIGAKHIYSEYWSCDRIDFQSQEQITCSVVNDQLQPSGDRYHANGVIVQSDPQSSYVFPLNSLQAKSSAQHFAHTSKHYQRFVFDGYIVYQPI